MSEKTSFPKCTFVYEADHINGIVYVDTDSMKRASQIDSPEFKKFLDVKASCPGYQFELRDFPKSTKRTYGGLTFKIMQALIIHYEETPEKAEAALREMNKAKAEGLLKGASYSAAKSWFLKKYGKKYNASPYAQKDGKRDALVKELLAQYEESLINPVAEIQNAGGNVNG